MAFGCEIAISLILLAKTSKRRYILWLMLCTSSVVVNHIIENDDWVMNFWCFL